MPSRFVFISTYILASRPLGVLYVGSTNDLLRRVWEHRESVRPGFTATHRRHLLVWCQQHGLMGAATARERATKHWSRAWKLTLIERDNPDWRDLYPSLL